MEKDGEFRVGRSCDTVGCSNKSDQTIEIDEDVSHICAQCLRNLGVETEGSIKTASAKLADQHQ